jgi:hypothetical protein
VPRTDPESVASHDQRLSGGHGAVHGRSRGAVRHRWRAYGT